MLLLFSERTRSYEEERDQFCCSYNPLVPLTIVNSIDNQISFPVKPELV